MWDCGWVGGIARPLTHLDVHIQTNLYFDLMGPFGIYGIGTGPEIHQRLEQKKSCSRLYNQSKMMLSCMGLETKMSVSHMVKHYADGTMKQ